MSDSDHVSADAVMVEIQDRVRQRVRAELLQHGAPAALGDAEIYDEVDRLLRGAIDRSGPRALLLPELLGDPDEWRLDTGMRYQSHRGGLGAVVIFVKRRLLMPVLRFLFEYTRDNFDRQQRVNLVLFACVQELAIENAALRRAIGQPGPPPSDSAGLPPSRNASVDRHSLGGGGQAGSTKPGA